MKLKSKKKLSSSNVNQLAVLSENVVEDKFERLIEDGSGGLSALMTQANHIQNECTDVEDVPMEHIVLDDSLHLVSTTSSLGLDVGLTPYAFSQLCTKIGVPTQYMKKCISSGFVDLVTENVNEWLQYFGGKKLLVRKYKNVARGILSDRYSVCDTPTILEAIDGSGILGNMDLKGYMMNPSRFHARFVGEKMNVDGEDLFAGIQIDSSDVGRSKLDIRFLIFKQVCTNGLILPKTVSEIYTQKHIGLSSDEMAKALKESMDSFTGKVEVAENMIETASEKRIDMYSLAPVIKNGAKIGDDAVDKIFEVASNNYSETIWGVVNAITEVSQDYTLEHRLVMERYAGNLLSHSLNH